MRRNTILSCAAAAVATSTSTTTATTTTTTTTTTTNIASAGPTPDVGPSRIMPASQPSLSSWTLSRLPYPPSCPWWRSSSSSSLSLSFSSSSSSSSSPPLMMTGGVRIRKPAARIPGAALIVSTAAAAVEAAFQCSHETKGKVPRYSGSGSGGGGGGEVGGGIRREHRGARRCFEEGEGGRRRRKGGVGVGVGVGSTAKLDYCLSHESAAASVAAKFSTRTRLFSAQEKGAERDGKNRNGRNGDGVVNKSDNNEANDDMDDDEDDEQYRLEIEAEKREIFRVYDDPPDSVVEAVTLDWIRRVVIGLNLCPFADKSLRTKELEVSVVRGSDEHTIAAAVLLEMHRKIDEAGTVVVAAPEFHPDDFESYLHMIQFLEDVVMKERDMDGLVQIAPFHPLFEFDGSGRDGVDNYTNRSPYPLFHVLREDEVEKAVSRLGGDAGKVWSRNVELLKNMEEALGREGVEKAMRGEEVEGLKDVLKATRDEFGDYDTEK